MQAAGLVRQPVIRRQYHGRDVPEVEKVIGAAVPCHLERGAEVELTELTELTELPGYEKQQEVHA